LRVKSAQIKNFNLRHFRPKEPKQFAPPALICASDGADPSGFWEGKPTIISARTMPRTRAFFIKNRNYVYGKTKGIKRGNK